MTQLIKRPIQLRLALPSETTVEVQPEIRRELITALATLLRTVAANRIATENKENKDDVQQDQR